MNKRTILEKLRLGITYTAIGRELGISRQRVQQIACDIKVIGSRDRARELIRKRDGHRCQICNKKWTKGRKFDVHHMDEAILGKIDTRKVPPSYDRKNTNKLVTLCHKCHLNLHYGNVKLPTEWTLRAGLVNVSIEVLK